jgi:hypothetical protein
MEDTFHVDDITPQCVIDAVLPAFQRADAKPRANDRRADCVVLLNLIKRLEEGTKISLGYDLPKTRHAETIYFFKVSKRGITWN